MAFAIPPVDGAVYLALFAIALLACGAPLLVLRRDGPARTARNMALAAIMGAFANRRTLAEALANELELAAKGDAQSSYAIKKRDETERMARSAR